MHVTWEAPPDITASTDGNISLMYVPVDVLEDAPNTFFMIAGFSQGTQNISCTDDVTDRPLVEAKNG